MEHTKQENYFQTRKKVPPRKPPRLSIKRKPGSNCSDQKEEKEGLVSPFINKNVIKNNKSTLENEEITAEEDYDEVFDAISKRTPKYQIWKEHFYESISDQPVACAAVVAAAPTMKNSSCQTEMCSTMNYYTATNTKHGSGGVGSVIQQEKTFKETSCQTDSLSETVIFRNRSALSAEDISTHTKDRLSSASSTQDSVDSGHYSVHPAERSPTSSNDDDLYLWQPEGLSQEKVKSFMDCLPSDKVPKMNQQEGIAYFKKQLIHQNPEQDIHPELCKSLTTKDQVMALKDFSIECGKSRGIGIIQLAENKSTDCQTCGKFFNENDITVVARDGLRHPSCFSCTVCHELLVKLIYYNNDNNRLYCGRHFAERFKPRCYHCDELVVCGQVTKAMGHTWHTHHFSCEKCGKKITDSQYTSATNVEEPRPMCLDCHTTHIAESCCSCQKKITLGQKTLTYDNKHWHEKCFVCQKCDNSLSIGRFRLKNNEIVCFKCSQNSSKLCCRCGNEIKAGSRLFEHGGSYYHDTCFSCEFCNQLINNGFMESEGCFYCPECYHRLFAEKCMSCKLPITDDGVSYNNEMWHNTCFDCFACHQPIASQKFLIRHDNRYCASCYEKLFAKQCQSCHQLIKDTAYLTNDDLNWHNHCFRCTGCNQDLQNSGFHMFDGDIYCAQCPT